MESIRLRQIYKRIAQFLADPNDMFLIGSIEEQKLYVCTRDRVVRDYPASSSRLGVGIREDSLKTPPGIHRICEKIGSGAPIGRIFRDREDTGANWDHTSDEENIILTRILRLEGLEPGINKGAEVDTYERYVYIHGTNREQDIGKPFSHGCICMLSADIIALFDTVREGTILYIDPPAMIINEIPFRNFHFTGIFGTGMSALAQYLRFCGIGVSGSDRLLGSSDTAEMKKLLEGLGCIITDQDGTGVTRDTDVLCVSTAIEETNPDIASARARGIPIIHRSDLLACIIASKRTIAVAGTSGKSTVTAMIFEFLHACGKSPSLISGAPLLRLEGNGLIGNAFAGGSDLLVVEADESDGTLAKYSPDISVILNISKDHKTIEEITSLFAGLIARSSWKATNYDDPVLATLPATVRFGRDGSATWRPDREEILKTSVRLVRRGIEYRLPVPGEHNLENLRAALCICEYLACDEEALARAVEAFAGVARRFAIVKTAREISVIDDFAHNPAKIAAAVNAARGISERIIAVYQPHGFGPTRFLKDEYITSFQKIFRPGDQLYLLPIYYAGGTAQKDISSQDIIDGLGKVPFHAEAVKDRKELTEKIGLDAHPGDSVIVMGARDPSLPALINKIVDLFGGKKS
ncbi:MAG: UDP-N-acetylmuramate--alanine ligase [Deltaproteobacteria bacterium]|nr:UDP-N-acetylmuramate--alanine ligase [Deltaproteobacteria bacterium]